MQRYGIARSSGYSALPSCWSQNAPFAPKLRQAEHRQCSSSRYRGRLGPKRMRNFLSAQQVSSMLSSMSNRGLQPTLKPYLVQKVHYHLVLLDPQAIKVFPACAGQLLFALSSLLLLPRHCRRHFPKRRSRKQELVIGVAESRRCVQSISMAIGMEN